MIGGEILLLEAKTTLVAETAVDEDDGRIAGAHLVIGDAGPVGGGNPISHGNQPSLSCPVSPGEARANAGVYIGGQGRLIWTTARWPEGKAQTRNLLLATALVAVLAWLAAACGDDGDGAAVTTATGAAAPQTQATETEPAAGEPADTQEPDQAREAADMKEPDEVQEALEGSMTVDAPEIREAEVAMGFNACCADVAFWQIPLELGWWDDLNITIVPNSPTYLYFASGAEAIAWAAER